MAETRCGFDDAEGQPKGFDLLTAFGPTLMVTVGFDGGFDPSRHTSPSLPATKWHALVDTGATMSCIDSGLAMQLNLPVVDRATIGGVSGSREVNMHMAQIHVPSLAFTIYGQFAGVDLIAGGQPHHVLIGRTFLQNFVMEYNGTTGTVTLRTP